MSIDSAASKFIENYMSIKRKIEFEAHPAHVESADIESSIDFGTEKSANVLLTRVLNPRFYAGILPKSGKPIWSDDPRHAKFVSAHLVHYYEEHLNELLFPVWYYAR